MLTLINTYTQHNMNDTDNTVYEVIHLPNGGTITMDKLAYESYQSVCNTTHKKQWKVTLDFEQDNIQTATMKRGNEVIYR